MLVIEPLVRQDHKYLARVVEYDLTRIQGKGNYILGSKSYVIYVTPKGFAEVEDAVELAKEWVKENTNRDYEVRREIEHLGMNKLMSPR